MTKVFFWAGDKGSGSTWYRCVLPAMSLTWLGHQTATSDNMGCTWQQADTIVGARVAAKGTETTWKTLKNLGKRLVIDLDDDYFHLESRYHPPAAIEQWRELAPSLARNMAISDVVTVASEAIAEVVREYTENVVVIPNGLHAMLLGTYRDYYPDRVVIGWSGSESTGGGLEQIKHPLRKAAELPNVDVRLVGPDPGLPLLNGLRRPNIHTAGFIPSQQDYLQACAGFDIWLAPYLDTQFNRAKFPTKVLESNFLGIPLIASNIRPYAEQIEHGKTGFLVKHDHEWRRYINLLVHEPALREEIGLNARAQASSSTMQNLNRLWEQVVCP